MEPNPYLVVSSILFVIPTTMSAYKRKWLLYGTYIYITIISSIYHATKYQPLLYLDYPGCYAIVIVTAYENWKTGRVLHWILATFMCGVLFWGGWVSNRFVFSPNQFEKNISHVGMHLIVNICGGLTSYLDNKPFQTSDSKKES